VNKNYDKMFSNTLLNIKEKTINFPQVDDIDAPYFCPGGHVNQQAHQELADRIRKILN
jgi:hypothetical protein